MRRSRVHPLFLLAALAGFAFCVTTLALVFTPWMEPPSPFVRWLEANALPLLASEIAVILIAGAGAMLFDAGPSESPDPSQAGAGPAAVSPLSPVPTSESTHEPQSPARD